MGTGKRTTTKLLQPIEVVKEADGTSKAMYSIADLTLDPENARQHADRDLNAIAASIRQYGQQKPVVIDADGIVRAGNGTCLALGRMARTKVWGVQSTLSGAEAVAYSLADNRTAELSTWDSEIVARSLKWLEDQGEDLSPIGWTDDELASFLKDKLGESDASPDTSSKLGNLEYRVIIVCASESQQSQLLERFEKEGLTCQALIS